jgi:tyrosyl-tRNA synthetase
MSSASHEPAAATAQALAHAVSRPPDAEHTRCARIPESAGGIAGHAAGDRAASPDPGRLAALLSGGSVDSLPQGALTEKLREAATEGRGLRVKLGIDPTAPDIHLGHAVVLRKLREFQDAGHRVVLIIGDYTARVGDPSGRSTLRPMLSNEAIEANAATFYEQALRILDPAPERLEVRRNREWLEMPIADWLILMSKVTAAQLLERDDFAKRMADKQPVSMLELMYPVLQGYDSVAVDADLELGGTDQKFNLLMGRSIQRAFGNSEQAIMTMPLLVGTDGQRKMSKSLGNHIGITEPPGEIYGKTMSIPDAIMGDYYRLLLGREPPAGADPREAKRELARGIVAWLYTAAQARDAEREFDHVFVHRRTPEEMPRVHVRPQNGVVHLPAVMAREFDLSRAEARRLIDQGAVTLGERAVASGGYDALVEHANGAVLRVGKRRFRRLVVGE